MMTHPDELKRRAALRAAELVERGTAIGLGTGSTVHHLLEVLGERLSAGSLEGVVAVPTSEDTAARCRRLGIPLVTLAERPILDLAIDGADEVGPRLALIKGLGGALLREKIVALAARRFVVIADESKRVRRLGTKAPVPAEVLPFGWTTLVPFLEGLGAEPALRRSDHGDPFVTDNGNYIVDLRFRRGLSDPTAVARALDRRPGIVEHGLFLGMVHLAVIAGAGGVKVLRR